MGFTGDAIQHIDSEDLVVGASWVCKFYNYRSSGTMSELEPSLLSCFKDESDALRVFNKEMTANAKAIKEDGGLFFSRGVDPMHPAVNSLSGQVLSSCQAMGVPVNFCTTYWEWAKDYPGYAAMLGINKGLVAFGADVGRPFYSGKVSSLEVVTEGLASLHKYGFKTWALFTPCVSVNSDDPYALDYDVAKSEEVFKSIVPFIDFVRVWITPVMVLSGVDSAGVSQILNKITSLAKKHKVHVILDSTVRHVVGFPDASSPSAPKWSKYKYLNTGQWPRFEVSFDDTREAGNIEAAVKEAMDATSEAAMRQHERRSKKNK